MKKLIFILSLFSLNAIAQISEEGRPLSFDFELKSEAKRIEFPQVNIEELIFQDSLDAIRNRPMRFGKAHEVSISFSNIGSWEIINNEYKVCRLEFVCPEAYSINLVYNNFQISEGAKLFIYDSDKSYVLGAFTSANNIDGNPEFATGLVPGEKIIVEYNSPIHIPNPQIEISSVVHGYKNILNFGDSGPCNNNVNCPEGLAWTDQINSIAMIVLGGTRLCSGAMINNSCEDGTPYFLTANHCLSSSGVNNWMFYFNYQSPTCADINGPTNQIVSGAKLISTSSSSDFALLELDSRPPVSYNTFYSGWYNINSPADTSISIHHPSGDIKKISFSNQSTESTDYLSNTLDSTQTHWRVPTWDDGTTEGGSSGSPLFNSKKQIVGQLHGGYASCTSITSDWYGKLSYSWDQGNTNNSILSVWLDPSQSNADTLNGNYFPVIPSLDVAIVNISSPQENSCRRTQIPGISFKNKGLDTINSLDLVWEITGLIGDTINWIGQLLPQQIISIDLDTIVLNYGNYNLQSEIINVNGQLDFNSCNNIKSKSFVITEGNEVTFNMRADNWPGELSLEIADTSGFVLNGLSTFRANTLDTFIFCLSPGCYDFTVFDSWGDGITGSGYFSIEYLDSVYFTANGAFGNCTGSPMPAGCSVTYRLCMDSSLLSQAPSAAYQISDTVFQIGDTIRILDLSANFPDTWEWTLINDSVNYNFSNKNIELIAQNAGWYDINLKVSNQLGADSLFESRAFRVESPSGYQNFYVPGEIKIYPNPAREILNIYSKVNENLKIEIINLEGKILKEVNFNEKEFHLDISDISPGLYLIKINSNSTLRTGKILIQ